MPELTAAQVGCIDEPVSAIMNKLACIAAFAVATSSAAAQVATRNDQTQTAIQGGAIGAPAAPTQAPITGVFCIEEMTANFCNVVTGPNTGGYGGRSGAGSGTGFASTGGTSGAGSVSAGGSAGGGTSSIPPCPAEPPFNELCN